MVVASEQYFTSFGYTAIIANINFAVTVINMHCGDSIRISPINNYIPIIIKMIICAVSVTMISLILL